MPDLATQHEDGVFEPDEDALIMALRNQDDIPILMDVVAEQAASSLSQEEHLAHSVETPLEEVVDSNISVNEVLSSQELIAKTVAEVLAQRLPELVAEVVTRLHAQVDKKD